LIVLDKPKLRFLLAGRTITVTVNHDRHRKGRSYSVSTAYNRPASCTATVIGIRVTASGRELQIIQSREAPERYLARSLARGYTTRPEDAIQDEGATALSREDLKSLAGAAQRRFDREQRDEINRQQARSIHAKLRDALKRDDATAILALRRELTIIARRVEAA
jgi:hypothetical protein